MHNGTPEPASPAAPGEFIAPNVAIIRTVRFIPGDGADKPLTVPRADIYRQRQVCAILGTDAKTVRALCEAGLLHGYRLPDSPAWLVPHDCLVAFAAKHNLSLDGLEPEPARK
jgi:hypothetical protein